MVGCNGEMISGVIVTYNRKELLLRCLDGIFSQSRPVDHVIIVDNASTDGTQNLLIRLGYLLNPIVDYIRMPCNSGGAGGFYEGMKKAWLYGSKWIWMMDDDGFPEKDCLIKLLRGALQHDLLFVGPLVINASNELLLSSGYGKLTNVAAAKHTAVKGLIVDLIKPFNGTLIHRTIMNEIGFIKKEMFIWGDETEYKHRAKSCGFTIGTITNAEFFHPEQKGEVCKILGGLLGSILIKPEDKAGIYFRNLGFINHTHRGFHFHIITLFQYFVYFLFTGQIARFLYFWKYYVDGAFDRYNLEPPKR